MELYLHQNGEQVGPYTEDQISSMLSSGQLSRDDIVWHAGLSEWQPIHSVFSLPAPVPIHLPPLASTNKKKPATGIGVGVVVVVLLIAVSWLYLKQKKDQNSDSAPSSRQTAGGVAGVLNNRPPFLISDEFGLGLGLTYDELTTKVKELRKSSIVSDASIGTVQAGWRPGSKSIDIEFAARQRFNFDLPIPTKDVSFYVSDQVVDAVSIDYSFKSEYRSDLFETLVDAIEKTVGVRPEIAITENDVGDRTKKATLRSGGLVFSVTDRLDGDFSAFAPDLRIYYDEGE